MTTPHLAQDISTEEGFRAQAYPDPLSGGPPWTIGYGSTGPDIVQGLVWTEEQAASRRDSDILNIIEFCKAHFPWWEGLSDLRQDVLVSMAYQMGTHGLILFNGTLGAIAAGDYAGAASHMLASKWATQTPQRAQRLAAQMRTNTSSYSAAPASVPTPTPTPQPKETPMSFLSKFVFNPILAEIARGFTSSNPAMQATAEAVTRPATATALVVPQGAVPVGSPNSPIGQTNPHIQALEDEFNAAVAKFVGNTIAAQVPLVGVLAEPFIEDKAKLLLQFAENHALSYVAGLFHFHINTQGSPPTS